MNYLLKNCKIGKKTSKYIFKMSKKRRKYYRFYKLSSGAYGEITNIPMI